jgi:hypothetical protein
MTIREAAAVQALYAAALVLPPTDPHAVCTCSSFDPSLMYALAFLRSTMPITGRARPGRPVRERWLELPCCTEKPHP